MREELQLLILAWRYSIVSSRLNVGAQSDRSFTEERLLIVDLHVVGARILLLCFLATSYDLPV